MQLTKIHKIIISVLAVFILLAIYIFIDLKSKNGQNPSNTATSSNETATTTLSGTQINIQGNGAYTIEQVGINEGRGVPQPIPDLNRVSVAASGVVVNPETKVVADSKIKSLQTNLKKNPADFDSWIDLGTYQKMAGDFAGAVISWKYASRLAPGDYISLGNLANIYAYHLKDNGQAEVNYKLAISNGPNQAYLYSQLAEIYRDIFKDTAKAKQIVNQGLSKVPNDPYLLQLKASLE